MKSIARLCICPCGRLSVQETSEDPLCHKCGNRYQTEIDWFNLDLEELKEDVQTALEVLNKLKEK